MSDALSITGDPAAMTKKMKPGIRKWYVLRTFSGHENKVKEAINNELELKNLQEHVNEVLIPTETVFEMRGGKKRTREKTFFPGYLLVEAHLTPYLGDVLSALPSVIGFLSTGDEPTPLRPDEVNRILGRVEDAAEAGEVPEMPFKENDAVKVVDGPFNNFSGFVEEVYPDKMKVRVMVSIFGRKTPLELDYLQVEHEA